MSGSKYAAALLPRPPRLSRPPGHGPGPGDAPGDSVDLGVDRALDGASPDLDLQIQ